MPVDGHRNGQKNFTLGPAASHFSEWCGLNAYTEKYVFLAGWRAIMNMEPGERQEHFFAAREWTEANCQVPPRKDWMKHPLF